MRCVRSYQRRAIGRSKCSKVQTPGQLSAWGVDSLSDKNETTQVLDPFRQLPNIATRSTTLLRASVDDIDLVSATYPFRIFALRSDHRLAAVLTPGYFDDLTDIGLRKHDEIKVAANYGGVGAYATLVVDEVKQGRARVSLLVAHRRCE
jgi:hypothetical protein